MVKKDVTKVVVAKGAKHPTKKGFTVDSLHETDKEADKAEGKLRKQPGVGVNDVERGRVKTPHLVYVRRGPRFPRLTPKFPKLT